MFISLLRTVTLSRRLARPSNAGRLQRLSEAIGGELVKGGFWRGDQIQVRYRQWIITLTAGQQGDHDFTRMRAPYATKDGHRFTIYHKGIFSDLGKRLGMQHLEIGDREFDNAFVIKGDNEAMLRELFANLKIRQLIAEHPAILVTVRNVEGCFRGTIPVDVLDMEIPSHVLEIEQLIPYYDLFGEILDQLCLIGTAHERNPGIAL